MIDLKELIQKTGVSLDDKQLSQLNTYYELLTETNKVMNLTAITEYDEVALKHFADSLAIVNAYEFPTASHIIDVGTGAGFPGIVHYTS